MSAFDPDSFLNQAEAGANSTSFEPIPDGEYVAMIGSDEKAVTPRQTNSGRLILDVTWEIDDMNLKTQLQRDKLTVRQSIFIDTTPQGTIDRGKGKNVQLGRVRDALGQNDPMKPWSPISLRGAGPAKIRVTQRSSEDGSQVYNDVKAVTKIS
jgi:hypothetical protein